MVGQARDAVNRGAEEARGYAGATTGSTYSSGSSGSTYGSTGTPGSTGNPGPGSSDFGRS
jgi:hypothetical protein